MKKKFKIKGQILLIIICLNYLKLRLISHLKFLKPVKNNIWLLSKGREKYQIQILQKVTFRLILILSLDKRGNKFRFKNLRNII